jgi:hypothetical protein
VQPGPLFLDLGPELACLRAVALGTGQCKTVGGLAVDGELGLVDGQPWVSIAVFEGADADDTSASRRGAVLFVDGAAVPFDPQSGFDRSSTVPMVAGAAISVEADFYDSTPVQLSGQLPGEFVVSAPLKGTPVPNTTDLNVGWAAAPGAASYQATVFVAGQQIASSGRVSTPATSLRIPAGAMGPGMLFVYAYGADLSSGEIAPFSVATYVAHSVGLQIVESSTSAAGWGLAGSNPELYLAAGSPTCSAPATFSLSSSVAVAGQFGTEAATVDATPFVGQRAKLTATLSTTGVESTAGLWMGVYTSAGAMTAFDNMDDRSLHGTLAAASYSVVLDVAPEAATITFGVLLDGPGVVTMTDLSLVPEP